MVHFLAEISLDGPMAAALVLAALLILGYGGMRFMRRVLRLQSIYVWETRKSLLRLLHHQPGEVPPACSGLDLLLRRIADSCESRGADDQAPTEIAALVRTVNENDFPRIQQILSLAREARIPTAVAEPARERMAEVQDLVRNLVLNGGCEQDGGGCREARDRLDALVKSLEGIRNEVVRSFASDLPRVLESRLEARAEILNRDGVKVDPIDNRVGGRAECRIDSSGLSLVIDSLLDLSISSLRGHQKRSLAITVARRGAWVVCEIADTGSPLPEDILRYPSRPVSGAMSGGRGGIGRALEVVETFECRLGFERRPGGSGNLIKLGVPLAMTENTED